MIESIVTMLMEIVGLNWSEKIIVNFVTRVNIAKLKM